MTEPSRLDELMREGEEALDGGEFETALECFDEVLEGNPDHVDLEGRIRETAGELAEADRLFAEASRLDPVQFPHPVRMKAEDFRSILDQVLASLPAPIRAAVTE